MERIKCRNFEDAAEAVAQDFVNTMKDEGFQTFEEMKRCYMWEPEEIKQEVSAILDEFTDCWMWDDTTHVQIGIEDMPYREFKKLWTSKVKELMNN